MSKQTKTKSIEETLWQSCDKLRGSIEPSEYKHVVLGLIFLKFASDKFEERKKELIAEGKEKYVEMKDFYNMKNVFFLQDTSRWSYIKANAKQDDLALKIDTALHQIEKNNPALKGALPDNYFSRLGLDRTKLASLIDKISEINTIADKQNDIVGRVYEYFLSKFAIKEGKGKGEFYTPKSIVNLIAEMIEPYQGIIYDPACGSGGMFVQSIKFIENHHGNKKEVSVYGQEYTNTTYKLAKMNLAIRGIAANLGEKAADTFGADQHPDLKADFIMANPPFNQKDWRAENELTDDPRWRGYEVPPKSNANYGWILNMVSKLSANGMAGFILANGALSGGGDEYKIRKKLIENNLVEAIVILPRNMFYTTDISVTLWILNNNKTQKVVSKGTETRHYRNREEEILFMDLRQQGEPFEKKYIQFSNTQIETIAKTYHTWQTVAPNNDTVTSSDSRGTSELYRKAKDQQQTNVVTSSVPTENVGMYREVYKDIPEYCYSATKDEVIKKDYSLVPSKYIEFVNQDENIDFHTKMQTLQTELKDLLEQEEASKAELQNVFKALGYEL